MTLDQKVGEDISQQASAVSKVGPDSLGDLMAWKNVAQGGFKIVATRRRKEGRGEIEVREEVERRKKEAKETESVAEAWTHTHSREERRGEHKRRRVFWSTE